MRKNVMYCKIILLIIAILTVFILIKMKEINQEEFEIFQIYTIKGGNYRRTQINVIAYVPEYDIDEMCKKVKNEYERINEKSDELLIKLYNSRKELKNINAQVKKNTKIIKKVNDYKSFSFKKNLPF